MGAAVVLAATAKPDSSLVCMLAVTVAGGRAESRRRQDDARMQWSSGSRVSGQPSSQSQFSRLLRDALADYRA